jgi:hypothetical protein
MEGMDDFLVQGLYSGNPKKSVNFIHIEKIYILKNA